MARGKQPPYTFRYFVNGVEYTKEQLRADKEFQRKIVNALGNSLNNSFSQNPEMYLKVCKAAEKREREASQGA